MGSSAEETKTPSLVLIPTLSSAFSPGRKASVEGLSLGSVLSAKAEARIGSAKPGKKNTRGLRESVTTLMLNSSMEPDLLGVRAERMGEAEAAAGGEEVEEEGVEVDDDKDDDDLRPSEKLASETRTSSAASLRAAVRLLLLLLLLLPSMPPRRRLDESEGEGRPAPLASEKNAIEVLIEINQSSEKKKARAFFRSLSSFFFFFFFPLLSFLHLSFRHAGHSSVCVCLRYAFERAAVSLAEGSSKKGRSGERAREESKRAIWKPVFLACS